MSDTLVLTVSPDCDGLLTGYPAPGNVPAPTYRTMLPFPRGLRSQVYGMITTANIRSFCFVTSAHGTLLATNQQTWALGTSPAARRPCKCSLSHLVTWGTHAVIPSD